MPNAFRNYGDLRVTMTSDWEWRYNNWGTGAVRAIEVYHAKSQVDLRPIGSFVSSSYIDRKALTGKRASLLVGNEPDAKGLTGVIPAVASLIGYTLPWNDGGGGGKFDGSFWRPIAPPGYVSLGGLGISSYAVPSFKGVCEKTCVLKDTCRIGSDSKYAMPERKFAKVLGLPCPKNFTTFSSKTPVFTKTTLPRGDDRFDEQDQAEPFLLFF
ncbi:hypothetical protein G6011_11798 [Alternaria panax]|uniref:Uncharacterized protein n=1 Tax=Alternaria panax TaxID=48097 RepID=A0AAD4FA72_9PLEO|nr:hypothetical protein G6011_11798 [Alternaria panax]